MNNDVIKLNEIVNDINHSIQELAALGQDGGFKVPLVITPEELAEMIGLPMGPWRPQSNYLLWFYALKITVYARHLLEESGRIFEQMDDDGYAQRVEQIIDTLDEQFHPRETAMHVYDKLLHPNLTNGAYKAG